MVGNRARIGLMGLGTVGSGLVRLLQDRGPEVAKLTGFEIEITRILVRDPAKPRAVAIDRSLLTTDPDDILNDESVDIIVEAIGGVEPTLGYVLRALASGKSVVTANKEIMADHGREVFAAAERHGVEIFFEGSVGGGIPVLRPLKESLAGNRLYHVVGIINGTTNYILTQMAEANQDYHHALQEAIRLGFAEPDPTADVEGHDAARKLAILASIAFHSRLRTPDVQTEGITRITPADIAYGKRRGWRLKLLAQARERDGQIEARVGPVFIGSQHPLANVSHELNAVLVEGEGIGETMFYGRGAGSLPTGSAVLGDVLQAVRHRARGVNFTSCGCYRSLPVREPAETLGRFYARVEVEKRPGLAAEIVRALESFGVGLEHLDYRDLPPPLAEISLVTQQCPEGEARRALAALGEARWVRGVGQLIRVEANGAPAPGFAAPEPVGAGRWRSA